jgi:hypothetical protein
MKWKQEGYWVGRDLRKKQMGIYVYPDPKRSILYRYCNLKKNQEIRSKKFEEIVKLGRKRMEIIQYRCCGNGFFEYGPGIFCQSIMKQIDI